MIPCEGSVCFKEIGENKGEILVRISNRVDVLECMFNVTQQS